MARRSFDTPKGIGLGIGKAPKLAATSPSTIAAPLKSKTEKYRPTFSENKTSSTSQAEKSSQKWPALDSHVSLKPASTTALQKSESGVATDPSGLNINPTSVAKYGLMSKEQCQTEVETRRLPVSDVPATPGIRIPMRLTGSLNGVSFHSAIRADKRSSSIYEIFDCRLILSLDDFSKILAGDGIVEVIHMSVYRPPNWKLPKDSEGTRHFGALAIDIGSFVKDDGIIFSVENDFYGQIGAPVCSAGAMPVVHTPKSHYLWRLNCLAAERGLFNVQLTPNFNAFHHNHFHYEVTAQGKHLFMR